MVRITIKIGGNMRGNNVKLKYGLLISAVIFLSIAYYFFKTDNVRGSTIIKTGDFTLTAENKWSADGKKSYVDLKWDSVNDLSAFGYQLYQSEDSKNWTLSPVSYGKSIKVLNVYPDEVRSNTLKTWMDGLNLKSSDDENLIQVTPVTLSQYSANPVYYLKKGMADYQYDVVMFGSWDANNKMDISNNGAAATKDFLAAGRGVLFGHDTVYYGHPVFFENFKNLIGIGTSKTVMTGSAQVKVVNDGYLMKYPFEMKNEMILTIPYAHSIELQQKSVGTTWLEFLNPSGAYPNPIPDDGTWRGGWYLKTNNNVGMIQTGHSNGASSLEERQIIANALYNLAQVSFETNAQDQTVKDNQPPKLAKVKQATIDDPSNITLEITSEDQGKEYEWYVTGTTKNNGVKKSDTVKESVISNIAGYKYVMDTLPTSKLKEQTEQMKDEYGRIDYSNYDLLVAPTGTTDKQSATYDAKKDASLTTYDTTASISNINVFTDLDKFLHIVSVDRANNVSEVKTIKIRDLLTKFYVTEKYKDVDGNELSEDTLSIVKKNENYNQSFKSISGYVAEGYQIEGQEKLLTNKEQAVTIEKVATNYTVTYYYKKIIQFNFQQVMVSQKEDVIMPNSGYLNITQKSTTQTFNKMNIEVQSGLDGEAIPYNSVAILKDPGDIQVLVDTIIPMYYKYAGYVMSTENNEHFSQERVPNKIAIKIDPSSSSYWLTVYLEPSIDQNTLSTPYSWGYKKNEFGTIGIE